MKKFGICTFMWAIILVSISILFQVGNWPDNYFKETIFWFLPSVFAFFVGMISESEFFETTGYIPDKGYYVGASIFFGIIILAFSIISNIKHWPRDWFMETLTWWPISVGSFYLGMRTEAIFDKLDDKKAHEASSTPANTTVQANKDKDDDSVSIVYAPVSIKDKIHQTEIQDIEFEDIVKPAVEEAKKTSVAEAAARLPEVKKGPEIVIVNRKDYFGDNE